MKKFFTILSVTAFAFTAQAQTVLTQWNFDASSTVASTGNGTISLIGGVVENIQTTSGACNCAFVAGNPNSGKAYTTKTYPDQGSGSGTAGIVFSTSTSSASNVSVSIDVYGSGTASKYFQLQYTTDGSTWSNVTSAPSALAATNTWLTVSAALPADAAGKANFALRAVTVFAPSTTSYTPNGTNYLPGGALRFDNVTIYDASLAVADFSKSNSALVKNTVIGESITFAKNADIQIVNAAGQVVKSAKVTEGSLLNVSSLAKGNYIVTGTVNGEKVSQKVIKN